MKKNKKDQMTTEQNPQEETLKQQNDETQELFTSELDNAEDACTEADEAEKEKDELATAQAEIAELRDKYLRKVAEFENFRKNMMKEKAELILNGGERTLTAILPVLDDFERALQNMNNAQDVAAVKEGVDLIYQKFLKTLEGQGLKRIDCTDADFNTDFHDAIALVPGQPDEKKGKVIDCVQTGYTLNDKVIRHAKVAVGQ